MRVGLNMRLVSGIAALSLAAAAQAAPAPETLGGAAQPCVEATARCASWLTLAGGPARSMVYATFPLDRRNVQVRRALVMVHGTLRNADHYFTTATGAAFLAKALGDTLVIAPAFHSAGKGCDDRLAEHEVSWSCTGDSWRSGGAALSDPGLTSFDFMDILLRRLADRSLFPNLQAVVIAGHSAGGQFVSRYEMSNQVHESLGLALAYVVANPSSYAWPVSDRALATDDAAPQTAARAWESEAPHSDFSFGPFDAAKAPKFDQWPYGLHNRGGYAARLGDEQLRRQLVARPTTYLLGQVDVLPLGGFDDSASAMAQGPTRRARGEAFVKLLNEKLGGSAKVIIVPECGHNDRCIYTTDTVLPVIFPTPR